jgi:hypothetical protein
MAEKLKSILKRTSWSLLLKAAIFGAAWWVLPFWLFLVIALYLYFVPNAGAGKVSAPFFVLLFISLLQHQSPLAAVIFAVVFYCILLIKDLLIIDRRSAYEILMLVLSYLLVRGFFLNTGGSLGGWALLYGVIVAYAVSALVTSFVKNFLEAEPSREVHVFRRMLGWMTFLLMWQLLIVGMFLPVNFLYQAAIVFLVAIIPISFVPQHIFGGFSRTKVLASGMVIFALLVIVLASAHWAI